MKSTCQKRNGIQTAPSTATADEREEGDNVTADTEEHRVPDNCRGRIVSLCRHDALCCLNNFIWRHEVRLWRLQCFKYLPEMNLGIFNDEIGHIVKFPAELGSHFLHGGVVGMELH